MESLKASVSGNAVSMYEELKRTRTSKENVVHFQNFYHPRHNNIETDYVLVSHLLNTKFNVEMNAAELCEKYSNGPKWPMFVSMVTTMLKQRFKDGFETLCEHIMEYSVSKLESTEEEEDDEREADYIIELVNSKPVYYRPVMYHHGRFRLPPVTNAILAVKTIMTAVLSNLSTKINSDSQFDQYDDQLPFKVVSDNCEVMSTLFLIERGSTNQEMRLYATLKKFVMDGVISFSNELWIDNRRYRCQLVPFLLHLASKKSESNDPVQKDLETRRMIFALYVLFAIFDLKGLYDMDMATRINFDALKRLGWDPDTYCYASDLPSIFYRDPEIMYRDPSDPTQQLNTWDVVKEMFCMPPDWVQPADKPISHEEMPDELTAYMQDFVEIP